MRVRGGASSADRVRINKLKWGLQPHYLKEPPTYATALKTINARDDTIMSGAGLWAGLRGSKVRTLNGDLADLPARRAVGSWRTRLD